jgi:hypothetical protein
MTVTDRWIDLLDPTAEALSNHVPESIHARAMEQLLAPSTHDDEPRAKLEGHGDYVFGVLLVAVEVPDSAGSQSAPSEPLPGYADVRLISLSTTRFRHRPVERGSIRANIWMYFAVLPGNLGP